MQLAYLVSKAIDDESWTGGLLVTDRRGLPVDFRYVEPIKPTRIQKLIYGGALKRYLLMDAIAGTLLKASGSKADWIFTGENELLELETPSSGRFVVIEPGGREPFDSRGEWHLTGVGKIALQVGASGQPVHLTFNSADEKETEKIADELAELSREFDFTEPLRRVREALTEICRNGHE